MLFLLTISKFSSVKEILFKLYNLTVLNVFAITILKNPKHKKSEKPNATFLALSRPSPSKGKKFNKFN
ncbi:hypothetical protein [Mycoplasmopsis arginini]|uniref:hypothetical protein n=1 Tax=Mycoplasmopsis arginini TaxID=2094 RepID=UPI000764BD5E|nr:hypothetical protein [Mycoplasmopsis arginini]